MPNLGDFIGSLMGEMAMARFRADAETARIAELYASHDLLKHFSIPRYRLPEVNIDIPAILPVGDVDKELPGRLKPSEILTLFETTLEQHLARQDVIVSPIAPWRKTLKKRLNRDLLEVLSTDLQPTSDQVVDRLLSITREVPNFSKAVKEAFPKLENALRQDLSQKILLARASATRIQVLVNTSSVSEVPDPDRIVRLRLSLREDAMEWTTIETDKGFKQRLIPE